MSRKPPEGLNYCLGKGCFWVYHVIIEWPDTGHTLSCAPCLPGFCAHLGLGTVSVSYCCDNRLPNVPFSSGAKVQHGSHWATIKVPTGLHSSRRLFGENPLWVFPSCWSSTVLFSGGPPSLSKASTTAPSNLWGSLLPPFPLIKTFLITQPNWITQDNLPISRSTD